MEYGCCIISPCLSQLFRQKVRLESRLSLMLELHTFFWQAADGLRFRLSNQSQLALYKMMVQPRTPLLPYFMRPFYPPGFSTIVDNQKLAGQHGGFCNLVICPTGFRRDIQSSQLMPRLSLALSKKEHGSQKPLERICFPFVCQERKMQQRYNVPSYEG